MSNIVITSSIKDEFIILLNNVIDVIRDGDEKNPGMVIKNNLDNMKEKRAVEILLRAIMDTVSCYVVKDNNLVSGDFQQQFSSLLQKPDNVAPPTSPYEIKGISNVVNFVIGDNNQLADPEQEKSKKEVERLTNELHESEKKHLTLMCEYKDAKNKGENESKSSSYLQIEIKKLNSKNEKLKNSNESLSKNLDDLNERITGFVNENTKLKLIENQYEQLKKTSEDLEINLEAARRENEELQNQMKTEETELNSAKTLSETLQKTVEDLNADRKRIWNENEIVTSELERTVQGLKNTLVGERKDRGIIETENNRVRLELEQTVQNLSNELNVKTVKK